jgi:glutathione S-transferase
MQADKEPSLMSLKFYAHPLSSYCMKVLIAFYERDIPFELKLMSSETPENGADFARLWPLQHMPLLMDGDAAVRESSIIIEHLDLHHGTAASMIPSQAKAALNVRFLDRVFDNFVMSPMQRIVFDYVRSPETRDATGVAAARELLDRTYAWLDAELPHSGWADGKAFSLADCASAPALLYADWVHAIPDAFPNLQDYRRRLLAQPSVARVIDEARPYRGLFPLGAPDRD